MAGCRRSEVKISELLKDGARSTLETGLSVNKFLRIRVFRYRQRCQHGKRHAGEIEDGVVCHELVGTSYIRASMTLFYRQIVPCTTVDLKHESSRESLPTSHQSSPMSLAVRILYR